MNSRSKLLPALLFALLWTGAQAQTPGLFSVVPAGDPTYAELKQLAQAGWIPQSGLASSLTRYDVARLIQKAEDSEKTIVLAQADLIPPPPAEGAEAPASGAAASPGIAVPSAVPPPPSDESVIAAPQAVSAAPQAAGTAPALTPAQEKALREQAIRNLNSLEEAYQFELKEVKDKLDALRKGADDTDAEQYELRKRLKGITQFPTIAVHGLGRAFGLSQQFSGNLPDYLATPGNRAFYGYLDLEPTGVVSKEVKWDTILRITEPFEPNAAPTFFLRRVTMQFNPPWFSATVGDFDEAYTPLTLWNRDTLDLEYKPEMWARWDDEAKYESFLNDEPKWPLRGLKIGSDAMWPDSPVLGEIKGSVFLDMLRNGFNDNGQYYFGPNIFTDWALGGTAEVKSQKWYWAGLSIQAKVDGYGLVLDEPLNSQPPGSPYGPYDPTTWAHQYLLGSFRPDLKVGLGGDWYIGAGMEYANSEYQDDKLSTDRSFNDFALLGGLYVEQGRSRLSLNYLNVGPYYYSPLAQTRQDNMSNPADLSSVAYMVSPDLYSPPLRYQYFLSGVPRPGDIYGFYDRTMDNTFPYGLATPNREGFGGELDLKALDQDALKIKGSVYFVQEITGNLVVDSGGAGFIPVDSPTGTTLVPIRNFVYVNIGPSFNLGPSVGFGRDLEIGTNVRYEQTTSDLGTLTSTWILGGIRADILPPWEMAFSYSWRRARGTEAGFDGTLYARYPYLYDNSDLGSYSPVSVNGTEQSLRVSSSVRVNGNSTIYADYDWTTGDLLALTPGQGTLDNQFVELTYEVKF
jgi:hypothetical protein